MRHGECIAVVGAGVMGHSIVQTFGQAGKDVILYDLSEQILQQAIKRIESNLREKGTPTKNSNAKSSERNV
jgi:3-hydroxyacyl-CoA dehydrogenase